MRKKYIAYILALVILCVFLNIKVFSQEDKIDINIVDNNLYTALKEELNRQQISAEYNDANQVIKMLPADIASVTSLKLNNSQITNVSGIEAFSLLENLNLRNNNITSLGDIYLLENLVTLDVAYNNLTNVENINSLTNLTELNVYNNNICDFSGLSNMTNLKKLIAGDNNKNETYTKNEMEISAIGTLTGLEEIDFSRNHTPSVLGEALKIRGLKKAYLQECNIDYMTMEGLLSLDNKPLERMKSLKVLDLYNNPLDSITGVTYISNLEELNIGKCNINDINEMLEEGEFVWENMTKLDISNNVVSGIDISTDAITYLRQRSTEGTLELNYENIIDTSDLPHTDTNGMQYVTYEDFGARCDGKYDDFIAIRNAHVFANNNNCEVRATSENAYHIFKYDEDGVKVYTNVDWQGATIIIHDENIEDSLGRTKQIFDVRSNNGQKKTIENPNITLDTTTKKIEGLESKISDFTSRGINRFLCFAENSNKKQHIRSGELEDSGANQIDGFIMDAEGNLLNDIQWDFENVTSLLIYPISDDKLTLKNGNFITNVYTDSHENLSEFTKRSIYFEGATNIEIDNVNHTISEDVVSGRYYGFLCFKYCGDVELKNSSLFARKQVSLAMYDLVMDECVNFTLKNLTSNDLTKGDNRWIIDKTDNCKDIVFENCELNGIDSHKTMYNLTVKNCEIGEWAFSLTGKGTANIIDTTVLSDYFIWLTQDYGSTWDGDVNIINCTHKYYGNDVYRFLDYRISRNSDNSLYDFGYDLHLPNIYIENLTLDCENLNNNQGSIPKDSYLIVSNWTDDLESVTPADEGYWPQIVFVNGYNFINCNANSPYIRVLNRDNTVFNTERCPVVITDLTLVDIDGTDFTNNFNLNKELVSIKNVRLEINENISAENTVAILKYDEPLVEATKVNTKYEYLFDEEGIYKIILNSKCFDANFNKEGIKVYEFEINRNPGHTHTMIETPYKEATCEEDGNIKYYYCSGCQKYFSDENGRTVIEPDSIIIPALGHDWGDWVIEKDATASEDGLKVRRCKRNSSHTESLPIARTPYSIIEGKNQEYNGDGKDLTFKIDGTYEKFSQVKVDNSVLAASQYTKRTGSTIITLKSSFLNTLAIGNHIIEFIFSDGKVSTSFKVTKVQENPNNNTVNNTVNDVSNNTANNTVDNTVNNTVNNTVDKENTVNNNANNNNNNNNGNDQNDSENAEEVIIVNNRYIRKNSNGGSTGEVITINGGTTTTTTSSSSNNNSSNSSSSSNAKNIKTGDYIIIAVALPIVIIIANIIISKVKKNKKEKNKKDENNQ